MASEMSIRFAKLLIKWRWAVVVASLIGVVGAATGARFLEFNADYQIYFDDENPQLQALRQLEKTYGKSENVLFVVAPKDGNVFTPETLATVEWLTKQAWQLPHSSRVDSITNFQYTRARGDELIMTDLVEAAASLSSASLAKIRTIALSEPRLVNRLISPKGHVTGINVLVRLPDKDIKEAPRVVDSARELVRQAKAQNPNVDVYLTGIVVFNSAFPEASRKDMEVLVPVMYVAVFLLLGMLLRSISGTLATILVSVVAIVITMGAAGATGLGLNPISLSAPTIVLTLAIAGSVHVIQAMINEMRKGASRNAAIVESLRINMQPVFLTSLTTVIGFLSLNFSEVPPLRDLGNMTAVGVGGAYLATILFLPALMAVLPIRVRPWTSDRRRAMEAHSNLVIGRYKWVGIVIGLLTIGLGFAIAKNELDDRFLEYFDESVPFRSETEFVVANLTGIYLIEYSVPAGKRNGVSDPQYLQKLDEFSEWYRKQPGVIHVNTFTDVMKRLNKNMHGDERDWYRLPNRADVAAQYMLLYEMSLPYGLDLNNQVSLDKSATKVTALLANMSSKELLDLEGRAQAWLDANAPGYMGAQGASPSLMFAHIGQRNIRAMLGASVLALVLISAVLFVALRSWRMGLISLLPNLIPAGMAFGLWGLLVGRVGASAAVVVSMTLGIVVDDTIHFLSKYNRARREQDLGAAQAIRYTFDTVGHALVFTSVVLMVGFSVLAFSAFELNATMGLLTAITIGFALIADFLLLPALLMFMDSKGARAPVLTRVADESSP